VSLARDLWTANADLAAAALAHPFVRGLADGSLPRPVYAGYVGQDAFFLDAYARAYAAGVLRSPDPAGLGAFADLLAGVREERRLHEGVAARWGIDLAAVEPAPATLAYTDFLLAAAGLGDLGVLCAAVTPCTRLYAHLGTALAAGAPAEPYREWVETYAAPGFAELAGTLEDLLDRYAADGPEVRRAYRRAMRLEVGFFDGALTPGG
jgi:thiaminase (transcriptional activator TenA)